MSQHSRPESVRQAIIEQLQTVIDPETGADVWRMRLVEDLTVDADGHVSYGFRPSSPLCPIAILLALAIKEAVGDTPGVTKQTIQVRGFVQAVQLAAFLNGQG